MPVATKLDRLVVHHDGLPRTNTWHSKITDILKTYLYCHFAYGQQILQGGDLPWEPSIHMIKWPFSNVVFWDHVTIKKHYISTTTVYMTVKFRELLLIKLQDPTITWWRDKLNTLYLHLYQTNGYQTWEGDEELRPITSHDSSMTLSCKVKWQIKYVISLLALDQWVPNMARWWQTMRGFQS